jgi:hypothetical protein
MATISEILREATDGQIDESVLSEIENAFNVRLEEKTKIHVDKALMEQDELYSTKLEELLEALDSDHSKKLKKVVEAVDSDRANKLKAVIAKYETILTEDASEFKESLIGSISEYLDAFLAESIPSEEIAEAVKNKKAVAVLENLRKHLAIDSALQKESIKDAVADGKQQINEASQKLESALEEKAKIESELSSIKASQFLAEKTQGLDERTSKYITKMLSSKPLEYIEENFDYTLKLFNKKEESRLEGLKEEALTETVKVDRVVEEKVEQPQSPYMTELQKY